jgi:ribonuclease HI
VGVGCSVVLPHTKVIIKLPEKASIFTAELKAIETALRHIHTSEELNNCAIFSDSRSAIEAIKKYNNPHPIVTEITTWLIRLSARQKTVKLCPATLMSPVTRQLT